MTGVDSYTGQRCELEGDSVDFEMVFRHNFLWRLYGTLLV